MKEEISKCISNILDNNSLEICEEKWKTVSQTLYDFIKNEEKIFGIPPSRDVLPQLFINDMTAEQIWQQIEFQNELVIAMKSEDVSNDTHNLCFRIADLCNRASDDANEFANDDVDDESDADDDGDASGELSSNDEDDIDGNEDLEDNDADDESDGEDSLSFLDENEDLNKSDEEEIDFDKDTFNEIALADDEDESDSDEEEKVDTNKKKEHHDGDEKELNKMPKKFGSSIIDSQFFNLQQSEWIADNDLIGKSLGDDIDLMEDVKSDEEGESDIMYENFFDPPEQNSEELTEENNDQTEENNNQAKSNFAEKLEKESALKKELEAETYLAEKPWIFKGEVQKVDRPENSTLEHHLEATVAVRMKPLITEEVNRNIEELILARIKNQSYDDVERKIKPIVDPKRFKEKLILDQEKSSKSLAAIYEEEYLRKQQEEKGKLQTLESVLTEGDEKPEELPIHKKIKSEMKNIFMKLDALFNYHYTPKYTPPEVKVVKNVKAISIEESTPAAVSDATLLAPQEIVAPIRGELKGKTEKDKTDRNRERRSKKKHQKLRARREETKLINQMKKRDKNGLLQTDASIKFVQKAVKKGQIKLLDNKQKAIKSSSAFFDEMQNVIANGTKKRKADDSSFNAGTNKKKRKNKPQTVSKLLL